MFGFRSCRFIFLIILGFYEPVTFSQVGKNITASDYTLQQVKLLQSPFTHAMQKDHEWLLALEPDRLLSGFRSEAGLKPKAPKYGGWESEGVAGHTLGHYLSACAFMYASTGDTALLHRLNYIVNELFLCQRANGNGYVAALPGGKKAFAEIAKGDIRSQGFDLNGLWVPWYVIHKLFSGLIDTYKITGNKKALNILTKLADWAYQENKNLSYAQMQQVLRCEQGGICESFAEMYALTSNKKYMRLAQRFNDDKLLKVLSKHEDSLAGMHANTQIPKIVGLASQYELSGLAKDSDVAAYFWQIVVNRHSYANGGNSEAEHFGMPDQVTTRLSDKTTETCNSYNMLKLTHHLFDWHPDGVDLQPSYYNNGNVDFGWSLMKQQPNIKSVRIEIEPDKVTQAKNWIAQAISNGYKVIATYHKYTVLGSDDTQELNNAALWWKQNYSALASSGSFTINLMNEWGSHNITASAYAIAYNNALSVIRSVYKGPVIIDIPGWGQETYTAYQACKTSDPVISDSNIILSAHIYPSGWNQGRNHTLQQSDLDDLYNTGRPCIVGEFGTGTGNCDWSSCVDYAKSKKWAVLAWAWNGDGGSLNMVSPSWSNNSTATDFTTNTYFNTVYQKL